MNSTRLTIGISPCPNDTFIFDAMLHQKTPLSKKYRFDYALHDIERLNQGALNEEWEIVKISCAHYAKVLHKYQLLKSGGAMGVGVGPLIVAKPAITLEHIANIATPGVNTTAHHIAKILLPKHIVYVQMPFHNIEHAVLEGHVDAGIIIHESRFTYEEKGLEKLMDLGARWARKTAMPIPLGCIVIKKTLSALSDDIEQAIQESLRYAKQHQPTLSEFVLQNAQNLRRDAIQQHINLYVNQYTGNMTTQGVNAIKQLAGVEG